MITPCAGALLLGPARLGHDRAYTAGGLLGATGLSVAFDSTWPHRCRHRPIALGHVGSD